MKIVGTLFILLIGCLFSYAQDCTPCVGINKIQIISPIDPFDTLAQLNAGSKVGLYVRIDDADIIAVAPDYTRLLEFTDDKKGNLLRKGRVIERSLERYTLTMEHDEEIWTNGFDFQSTIVSNEGHALEINIESMARPTNGAQSLYLEGQIGVYVSSDLTEEVLVKNVKLSKDSTTQVALNDKTLTLTYVRSDSSGTTPAHVFSYSTDSGIIGVSESAARSSVSNLKPNEVAVSSFENLQLMVEVPKPVLREIPFTLTFGLSL